MRDYQKIRDVLIWRLDDADPNIRVEYASTLEGDEVAEQYSSFTTRLDSVLRARCARGLGTIGDSESRAALVRRLNDLDTDGFARTAWMRCLEAETADQEARDELLRLLDDPEAMPETRAECAVRLLMIEEARAAVLERLDDFYDDPVLRETCAAPGLTIEKEPLRALSH